jgi:protein-L-isoaspartate(D-aspartate) O-methyltransferase
MKSLSFMSGISAAIIYNRLQWLLLKILCLTFALTFLFLLFIGKAFGEEALIYKKARDRMVRTQIKSRGISDTATIQAMESVPRHLFVPEDLIPDAYDDRPLPIGYGQTISQPYIVAYMTEIVQPKPRQRVLEIGTGSGYQAAILAETGVSVYTVEIIPGLAKSASERLRRLGYGRVQVKSDDGYYGWEKHAPYDAIVVTAAAEYVPPPLLEQLKDGGRMVIPVGSPFFVQTLMLVEKHGKETVTHSLMPVRFVPFRRAE